MKKCGKGSGNMPKAEKVFEIFPKAKYFPKVLESVPKIISTFITHGFKKVS